MCLRRCLEKVPAFKIVKMFTTTSLITLSISMLLYISSVFEHYLILLCLVVNKTFIITCECFQYHHIDFTAVSHRRIIIKKYVCRDRCISEELRIIFMHSCWKTHALKPHAVNSKLVL